MGGGVFRRDTADLRVVVGGFFPVGLNKMHEGEIVMSCDAFGKLVI